MVGPMIDDQAEDHLAQPMSPPPQLDIQTNQNSATMNHRNGGEPHEFERNMQNIDHKLH